MKRTTPLIAVSAALLSQLFTTESSACGKPGCSSTLFAEQVKDSRYSQRDLEKNNEALHNAASKKASKSTPTKVSIPPLGVYRASPKRLAELLNLSDLTREQTCELYARGVESLTMKQKLKMGNSFLSELEITSEYRTAVVGPSDRRLAVSKHPTIETSSFKCHDTLQGLTLYNISCVLNLFSELVRSSQLDKNTSLKRRYGAAIKSNLKYYHECDQFINSIDRNIEKLKTKYSSVDDKVNSLLGNPYISQMLSEYSIDGNLIVLDAQKIDFFPEPLKKFFGLKEINNSLFHLIDGFIAQRPQRYMTLMSMCSDDFKPVDDIEFVASREIIEEEFSILSKRFDYLVKHSKHIQAQNEGPVQPENPFVMTTEAPRSGYKASLELAEAERLKAERENAAKETKATQRAALEQTQAAERDYKAWMRDLIEAEMNKRLDSDSDNEDVSEENTDFPRKVARWLKTEEEVQKYLHLTEIFRGARNVHELNEILEAEGKASKGLNIEKMDFEGREVISIRFNNQFRFILYKGAGSEYFQTIFTKHYKK